MKRSGDFSWPGCLLVLCATSGEVFFFVRGRCSCLEKGGYGGVQGDLVLVLDEHQLKFMPRYVPDFGLTKSNPVPNPTPNPTTTKNISEKHK